jgi:putative SOS response-associated peptidase YedK
MCGRFTLVVSFEDLKRYIAAQYDIFDVEEALFSPRYNIAPSQQVVTVINDGNRYRLGTLKWGLVPPFATDEKIGYALINAKAETIMSKPSFRSSFEKRRCLILADGFYEWEKTDQGKLPHRFVLQNRTVFAMAGVWSGYTKPDGTRLYTCAIITTQANNLMAPYHDRMPVIIPEADQKQWLAPTSDSETLVKLMKPYDPSLMNQYRVATAVNNPFLEAPNLIEPIKE